jgi:hypothetical protein
VDVLFGGFGNDTLLARDGIGERVDCSRGTDSATIDDIDSPNGCETVDSSPEQIPDRDGDGISKPADCNDANDAIRPGAFDVPDDNVDQNCDGVDAVNLDRDRDGVNRPQDCDDSQASRHPGAFDIPGNRLDEDCDLADAPLPQLKPGLSYFAAPAGTRSRLTRLTITGIQRGDVVAISCPKPKSCKVRDRTVTAPRAGTLPLARYVKARLARRTVIQLVVSRAGFRSSTFLLTMKGPGKAPAVAQLCEPAGDEPSTKCS